MDSSIHSSKWTASTVVLQFNYMYDQYVDLLGDINVKWSETYWQFYAHTLLSQNMKDVY